MHIVYWHADFKLNKNNFNIINLMSLTQSKIPYPKATIINKQIKYFKQAFWKYCLSNTCPLPAPTNIEEALLLQKQINLNLICKSKSQKTA